MTALLVEACGPTTSLQDAGRFGWQRYGVSSSGAMDRLALATANVLVGNGPEEAAIEMVLMGLTLTVTGGPARLALAGADCRVTLDGASVAPGTSLLARDGATVMVGTARAGTFAYLAVEGGLAVPPMLGSLSLQPRASLGGLEGRALRAGDRLPLRLDAAPKRAESTLDPVPPDPDEVVRVVLGPQDDHFPQESIAGFLAADYTVTNEADRMGYRLSGPRIRHGEKGFNIISDGIVAGSIQVPGSGEPIVLLADRQTTGGYPKIATVISADLRRVAQRRPGQPLRFEAVSMVEAQSLARERGRLIASLADALRPAAGRLPPSSEELLALNLAGAATDALADSA